MDIIGLRQGGGIRITLLVLLCALFLADCGGGRVVPGEAEGPVILVQPADQTALAGSVATFKVEATGTPPLSYQWARNGIAIQDAEGPTYSTDTDCNDDAAIFSVTVTAMTGSVTSGAAKLHVVGTSPNGLALSPLMGWSSWSFLRYGPTEVTIKAQADQVAARLLPHGYRYVNLDEGWYLAPDVEVDAFGRWMPDSIAFPSGMKALGDYIHDLGLRFGLYVTPGIPSAAVDLNSPIEGTPYHALDVADTSQIQQNYSIRTTTDHAMYYIDFTKPGAQEFISSWARLFASWGVDFVKLDGVVHDQSGSPGDNLPDIRAWSYALNHCGRPIHLALSGTHTVASAPFFKSHANSWRVGADIESYGAKLTDWAHLLTRFDQALDWGPLCAPGGWMDLDSMEIANGDQDGLTDEEKKTCVTLWAMTCSEFYCGDDLTRTDEFGLSLLTNDEVIAINQSGIPAVPINVGLSQRVWYKLLPDGSTAIALFNMADAAAGVTVNFKDCGIQGPGTVRDIWLDTVLALNATSFVNPGLAAHGCQLIRVQP